MRISGKTAVVTGGADGIGLALARLLKAKGAHVVVCARREERLAAAREEGFEAIRADLANEAGVTAFAQALDGREIDIFINNAGAGSTYDLNGETDLADSDASIYLNLNAPIRLASLMAPKLRTRPEAALVNVTSGLAIAPRAGGPVYCATKAGLRSFTKAIRHQLKDTKVNVIEALPPVVDTAMTTQRTGKKMSADDCAAEIVAAIEANRSEANVGMVKLLKLVNSMSPKLAEAIMIRF